MIMDSFIPNVMCHINVFLYCKYLFIFFRGDQKWLMNTFYSSLLAFGLNPSILSSIKYINENQCSYNWFLVRLHSNENQMSSQSATVNSNTGQVIGWFQTLFLWILKKFYFGISTIATNLSTKMSQDTGKRGHVTGRFWRNRLLLTAYFWWWIWCLSRNSKIKLF